MWPSRLEKSSTDRIRRAGAQVQAPPHQMQRQYSWAPLIQKVREFMTGSPTSQKAPHPARCWLPSAQTSSLNPGNRVRTGSSLWNGSATRRMSIVLKRNKKRSKAMCASELDGGGRAVWMCRIRWRAAISSCSLAKASGKTKARAQEQKVGATITPS